MNGADSVRSLTCGLPSDVRRKRLLFMLTAFIDDSGNNAETPVMVLAGFVARPEAWAAFSDEWEGCIKGEGISAFKMNPCFARRGGFTGWSVERRDALVLELIDIIRRHVMASAFAIIRPAEFREFIESHGRPKGMRSPYFILYHAIIAAVLRSMRALDLDDKVDFVFDEQFTLSDVVQSKYTEALELMEPTLASRMGGRPVHRRDDGMPPLQAADLLAWHIRRWYAADAKGEKFEPQSLLLLRKIPFWGTDIDKEALGAFTDTRRELEFKTTLLAEVTKGLIDAGVIEPRDAKPVSIADLSISKGRWRQTLPQK